MNLVNGEIISAKDSAEVLETLPQRLLNTLSSPPLPPDTVINACDRVLSSLDAPRYLQILEGIGIDKRQGERYLQMAGPMFSRGYLQARLERELGPARQIYTPAFAAQQVEERILPLGVLLHIAAGNADGLPAFSVLEGLLAGNINILKLPEVDGGISVLLLQELIQAEPALAEYIYVFDYSSRDTASIAKLIGAADGVVVWGGDPAVSALRRMVPPNIRLIEWGHKLSFAYVTKAGMNPEALAGLAEHICRTNQLLCSSCQGIFVDTTDREELTAFCELFLPILERQAAEEQSNWGIGTQAQITLRLQSELLASSSRNSAVFQGKGCSLIVYPDSELEKSIQFRNCWVKPLPQQNLIPALRPYKNHLHTAGLLCGLEEQARLREPLARAGVVRVTDGAGISVSYCGAAHDGEYSLRRYTKIVSFEQL